VGEAPGDLLPAMLRALRHRGPDDEGLHVDRTGPVGLGTRRLAIIDPAGGRQPMATPDGDVTVAFNGEIYNFRELRVTLEAAGHQFRTRSDTEVLLHSYRTWGEACAERLRGMFAFAVWDRRRRRLVLGRDRLGKKPLYYWQGGGLFLFASELKALLRHGGIARRLDWEAFHHYLAFGYTPGDRSILDGVAKLPAAHVAVLEDGRLRLARYWSLPPGAGVAPVAAGEAAGRVREAVREAVRLRLESDVPLGVFLSGGIDSSVIVAGMREVTGGGISTFTIGFGPAAAAYDERRYARMVAERFGTDHHEEIVDPKVAELLPAIVRALDEPFADSSAVPTFVVAQATAGHVRVALSGIGGDEVFAGYPRYLAVRLSRLWEVVPRPLRALTAAGARSLVPGFETGSSWPGRVRRFLAAAADPLPGRYIGWTRFFDEPGLAGLATPALAALWREDVEARARAAWASHGHGDPLDGAFRIDLATYLSDDLLVMADRMTMAHSLELRAPLCDHRLIELSLRIPPAVKLPGLSLKGLLKSAFADVLPAPLLTRPKQGFMIPLGRWLKTDLRRLVEDLLSAARVRARGLFRPEAVAALAEEHMAGRRDHADRLWTLVMAELWMQEYLDGAAGGPGARWSLGC